MKIVRKFVWLLLTLGLLALTVQTASPIALGLAACMVLLPLLCLPMNLYAAKKLKLTVRLPVNLRKGEGGTAELTVQNPTVFPICQISCRVRLENQLNGEPQTVNVSSGIWPKGRRTMKISLQSPWCGRIRLAVESARLYDCFGLIGVKTQPDAHGACVVQPDTFLQTLMLSPAAAHIDDTEDYSNERPGYDLSEMFQIRDYVPGDSQRQVHWKLSHKYGKLIVKDPSLPITRSAAVFWERTEENPTADRSRDRRFRLPESAFPVRPVYGGMERGRYRPLCVPADPGYGRPHRPAAAPAHGASGYRRQRCVAASPRGTCRKLVASDLRFR